MLMEKTVEKYVNLYGKMLEEYHFSDVEEKKKSYGKRLSDGESCHDEVIRRG